MSNAFFQLEVFSSILSISKERAKEWLNGVSNIEGVEIRNTALILNSIDNADLHGGDIEYSVRLGEIRVERKGYYAGIFFDCEFHLLELTSNGVDADTWEYRTMLPIKGSGKNIDYILQFEDRTEPKTRFSWHVKYHPEARLEFESFELN